MAKTFTDALERTWEVPVNVGSLTRVKELLGFWLPDFVGDSFQLLAKVISDDVRLVEVLCALCRPQLKERDLSDEEFAAGMLGDALAKGAEAMLEGLADFFREPAVREAFRKVIETAELARREAAGNLMRQLKKLDTHQMAQKALRLVSTPNACAGKSPASLASPRSRSRSKASA